MSLSARRLIHRVTLQELHQVDNGRGGKRPADGEDRWRDVDQLWAEVLPIRGGEALLDSIERHLATWRVTIRARPGVAPTGRFLWVTPELGQLTLAIQSIGMTEERDGLVITCQSGQPG